MDYDAERDGRTHPTSQERARVRAPARLYYEAARAGNSALSEWHGRVDVPTGYAVYPFELLQTPRVWAERRYNLVHHTVQDRVGHFAAFEQPEIFAADVITYGETLHEWLTVS